MDLTCIVYVDLDNSGKVVNNQGWSEYSPNAITRELTHLVDELSSKYFAVVLWGLDYKRGTEEAILRISADKEDLRKELEEMKTRINDLSQKLDSNTSLSIGVSCGQIRRVKPLTNTKQSTLKKYPTLFSAYKALQKAKKDGGNKIVEF